MCTAGGILISVTLLINIVIHFSKTESYHTDSILFIVKKLISVLLLVLVFCTSHVYKDIVRIMIDIGQGISDQIFTASNRKAMIAIRLLSASGAEAGESGKFNIDPDIMSSSIEDIISSVSYILLTLFYLLINSVPGLLITFVVILGPVAASLSYFKSEILLAWLSLFLGTVMYSVIASAVLFTIQSYQLIEITGDFCFEGTSAGILVTSAMGIVMLCCTGTIVSGLFGIKRFDFGSLILSAILFVVSYAAGATTIAITSGRRLVDDIFKGD